MKSQVWCSALFGAVFLFAPSSGISDTYSVLGDTIGSTADVAFVSGGIYFTHGSIALAKDAQVLNISSEGDPVGFFSYLFSVDKNARGLAGTAVRHFYEQEILTHGASDDLFRLGDDPVLGTVVNSIYRAGITHPYELDAYDTATLRSGDRIYFSASGESAGGIALATNVIYTSTIGSSATEPGVFATAAQLGLQSGDVIDAIDLVDIDRNGTFDDRLDLLVFSLTLDSPSFVAGYQIYGTDGGEIIPLVKSSDLGLLDSDELDALAHTPEPASCILLGVGLLGLLVGRTRQRRAD